MNENEIKIIQKNGKYVVTQNSNFWFEIESENITPDLVYEVLKKNNVNDSYKDFLIEELQNKYKEKVEKELDGIENTETDSNGIEAEEILSPYNPEKVKYSLKLFSVLTLYNYISGYDNTEEPTIDLKPDFQRNLVWSNKAKSLLIESILLNIPIPSVYLNQSNSESYFPADGLQRLNALHEFMSGELKLVGLEYLSQYNGYKYKKKTVHDLELPLNIKRKIRDYQITCFVIEKETPDRVKLDIFKRLNSTGIRLSPQELRNSITTDEIRSIFREIESNEYFKNIISRSVNTNRFVHHEFILRFIGSYLWQVKGSMIYKGSMNAFLDEVVIFLKNNEDSSLKQEIIEKFKESLEKAYLIFGDDVFRKIYEKRKGPLNTVLYSQILVNLVTDDFKFDFSIMKPGTYAENFRDLMKYDSEFFLAISSATNNVKNINIANNKIKDFFKDPSKERTRN
ncbi:DUF262 domain-containing protein [Lactococcus lactis]|uniref:DUF262 domain-containing protein n=1 Tax=Lactococcus lactis TaxID=1358 RepID=UPI0024A920C1|nr:DUF262 domain-containing protein [Lactococcus lactis]